MAADADELTRTLLGLVPGRPAAPGEEIPTATGRRILAAANDLFAVQGVGGTTMSQIAREAGVSREWLYRHHANRDAVLAAVVRWRLVEFLRDIARVATDVRDPVDGVSAAFVHAVRHGRDDPLFRRLLAERGLAPDADLPAAGLEVVLAHATAISAAHLDSLLDLPPRRALLVAETLGRVVVSVVLAPGDLSDDRRLRAFARGLVAALLTTPT
jgi:AcrR family transcriptional regulator